MGFKPSQLIRRGFVPPGVYTVHVHSCKATNSKAGNAMAELDVEILSPATAIAFDSAGQPAEYKTEHTRFRAWWTLSPNDYLPDNIVKLQELGVVLQADYPGPHEMIADALAQLPKLIEHKVFETALTTRPNYARRPLTAEDIAAGITEGEILRDPATGKERILGHNVQMNLNGVCSPPRDANAPY